MCVGMYSGSHTFEMSSESFFLNSVADLANNMLIILAVDLPV